MPGKNIANVGGRSLVARAVEAVRRVPAIDHVFVSTDAADIASKARHAGAAIVDRPADLASDHATSESALLHACDQIEEQLGVKPTVLVFVQATSPFLDAAALDLAVRRVATSEVDSVFSAVETYEFLWGLDAGGNAAGINHDAAYRPRRQDRDPHFRETGAFYVMSWGGFRVHGHRFFGRVGVQPVAEVTAIEIDTAEDMELARVIAPWFDENSRPEGVDLSGIRYLVTDFDGVHTDDTVSVSEDGVESVVVSRSDGLGLEMLRSSGVPLLILSKERNAVVAARARKLHAAVIQATDDKRSALLDWALPASVELNAVAYVGNDINDLEVMSVVGMPIAVADAHPAVRSAARLVLTRPGGRGALRELVDLILNANEQKE